MGAHVWFPAYLRDHLLPSWRVAGWSPDWFAGFPAGQFYFPLPALLVVARSTSSCRTTSRSSSSPRSGRCCSRPAPTSSAAGSRSAGPGPSCSRSARRCSSSSRASRATPGTPRRDDPVQPADHGRADRQRAGGGVLVHARARVRRSRSSARSRTRCATRRRLWLPAVLLAADGALPHRRRHLRRDRRARRLAVPPPGAHASASRPRSARSARCSPRSGRCRCSRRSATRRTCGTRSSPGTSTTSSRASSGGSSRSRAIGAVIGLVRRDRGVLTIAHASRVAFAVVFRLWPELHAWNLRFLPFWYLGLYLLAAVGVAEIVRGASRSSSRSSGSARRPGSTRTGSSTRSSTAAASGW